MIRHCVLLRFNDGTTESTITTIVEALRALPDQIPTIVSYEVGADLGWRDDNAGLGIAAVFADHDGWRTYADHPAHLAVIAEHIVPHVASRIAVQFEVPG